MRQRNRRLTRKTSGFSKEVSWLEKQLWLALAYDHLVLPHESLRQHLASREPTRRNDSARRWCAITPAMVAGLSDQIWSLNALLSYSMPAAFLDGMPDLEHLFPSLEPVH